jgi:uncharacterized spore protein YtfJ
MTPAVGGVMLRTRTNEEDRMSTMTTDVPTEATAARRVDAMLATLSERLGTQFSATNVFSAPIERDGVTVVPVASVRFGLGGGGGEDREKHQDGAGAGAGGTVTPMGYIEVREGQSRYVPLVHPARMMALTCAVVLAGLAILRPLLQPRPASRRLRRPR